MTPSLVYSNIRAYRLAMNLLYGGEYRRRFTDVIDLIGPDTRSVCDLCFGDTVIADWCRARGIQWTGVDLNPQFCDSARRRHHTVIQGDVFTVDLPRADVFVMVGSLYHFSSQLDSLFSRIWSRTTRFLLSEPVRNLSSQPGLVGWLARRSANPGDGHAEFRYDESTLLAALRQQQTRDGFSFDVASVRRDMVVVIDRPVRRAARTP